MLKCRKGSAVGIVLVAFSILIYIIIPFAKGAFEMIYYSHIRERAIAMTDSAIFSAAADIDSEAYSEGRIALASADIENKLLDPGGVIRVKKAEISFSGGVATINFEFGAPRVFSDRGGDLRVRAHYNFEMLNGRNY